MANNLKILTNGDNIAKLGNTILRSGTTDYDPVAGFYFEDNLNSYVDPSDNLVDLSYNEPTTYTDNAISLGKSMNFDYTLSDPAVGQVAYSFNSFISDASSILNAFDNDFTFTFWFKHTAHHPTPTNIFKIGDTVYGNGYTRKNGLYVELLGNSSPEYTNQLRVAMYTYDASTDTNVEEIWYENPSNPPFTYVYPGQDIWHFIGVSRESNDFSVYLDGSIAYFGTTSMTLIHDELLIGAEGLWYPPTGHEAFHAYKGYISNLKIYDKKLTQLELANLYNSGI